MKSHFNPLSTSPGTINKLIESLSSKDLSERTQAEYRLIEIGNPAVTALIQMASQNKSDHRWKAASILGDIRDPSAISTLINLLIDETVEVRWRAAESLIKMGRETVVPLFQELLKKDRFGSMWFLDGVHHILRKLDDEGYLGPPSQAVLKAFDDPVKEIAIPEAAEKALEMLKHLNV